MQAVTIKSTRNGINLVLDSDVDFDTLKQELKGKFERSASFFEGAEVAVSFQNRELTSQEEQELIQIMEETGLNVLFIQDQDELHESLIGSRIEAFQEGGPEAVAGDTIIRVHGYFRGSLKAGHILESRESVMILGDVEKGSEVLSLGDIVILGSLQGGAHAGLGGDESRVVAAMEMAPTQITIAGIATEEQPRPPKKRFFRRREPENTYHPHYARRQGEQIVYQPINADTLKEFF